MARGMVRDARIGKFVERQMRNWELAAGQATATSVTEAPTLHLAVTISREHGCRGEAIADRLAKRLGWTKFDREILDYMAKQAQPRRRLLEMTDEHHCSWMDDIAQLLIPEGLSGRRDYFYALTRAVLAICHHEHAVIVGRGANFFLPEDAALRVRLVAPLDYRVTTVATAEGLEANAARQRIRQLDAQRSKFIASRFGRFPYDPRHYDLTLNTAEFTDDQVCDVLIAAIRTKPGGSDLGA